MRFIPFFHIRCSVTAAANSEYQATTRELNLIVLRLFGFLLLFALTAIAHANDEFPGRKLYLGTPYIELKDLHASLDSSVILDVRSSYEYQTLHIKDAINTPIKAKDFISRVKKLQQQNKGKTLVTYCNGKTCMKSYKAAAKCRRSGIENVKVFDAGILDWATAFPDKAVLLGKSPIDPSRIISKKEFKAHLLKHDEFIKKANGQNVMIIDIRDPTQRAGMSLFIGREKRVPLDKQEDMRPFIEQAIKSKKTIFIYDEAGKQVRWLMYYLQDIGAKDFYFMDGGMKKYFASLRSDF